MLTWISDYQFFGHMWDYLLCPGKVISTCVTQSTVKLKIFVNIYVCRFGIIEIFHVLHPIEFIIDLSCLAYDA